MDTDDLSSEAYKGIILEADIFLNDLALQFGALAYHCKNEHAYLIKAKMLISEIKGLDNDDLSDMFFGSIPDKKLLYITLDKIFNNILAVEKIPENTRHYDFD